MDNIDYKQIAKNVLKLIDKNQSKRMIQCYIKYALNPDDLKYLEKNYTLIWHALDIIDEK
jgi:hypothetical protein